MQRITITLEDDLAAEIDRLVKARGFQNRSAAIRELTRRGIRQTAEERESRGGCVAALVYVYEHERRTLSKRLTKIFHNHHDLSVSAMHVHLDHNACLELNVLRGTSREVKQLPDRVLSERGVSYGRLLIIPAELESETHGHEGRPGRLHEHVHVPKAG